MLQTNEDAYQLLKQLGASPHLLLHLQLVGEAASELIASYQAFGLNFDPQWIELGAALHDAGKILHPDELHGPGSLHEEAGQALLLTHGVSPEIARCCVSHAAWHLPQVSFEERSVALADKLWKGKREAALELLIIDAVSFQLGCTRWDVFAEVDEVFEEIAAQGDIRLKRSCQY